MDSFLSQVARSLYDKYGDEISSLSIIFPSRRARLFFAEALSEIIDKPLWQPLYTSIDEVMEEIAGIKRGDRVRLITELYKVYSQFHQESFDSFYFWGEVLLSDFDSVDKYLLDADMLFSNVSDLKKLDDLEYLSEEQKAVIARFWGSFGSKDNFSDEQRKFMGIWSTLSPVYHDYKAALERNGLAYTGMVYRRAAESIRRGEAQVHEKKRYVIAGFNALSECEKILFDHLDAEHDVEFFWDYDRYYLDDPQQEAGLFLRENIRRYPRRTELPYSHDTFTGAKKITAIAAPSDSMQCKYIAEFLADVQRRQGRPPGKETAIVLTDENLLIPALHSIPYDVEDINVTMGYPLKQTLAYSFVERLLSLQARKQLRVGRTMFYHEDLRGLLEHPYVLERCPDAVNFSAKIGEKQQIYTDAGSMELPENIHILFNAVPDDWNALGAYIKKMLSAFMPVKGEAEEADVEFRQRVEFFTLMAENIDKLSNTLTNCGVELSVKIFSSLLRRMLQSLRVPYEGEPLRGVQVMGILETRNLDFDNVLILSVNDDTFPGNLASTPSFIPYNLKLAYGLPTPQHHEGVYAYYFYRLLQRATSVHLCYSARSDEKSSGEQSRYIYQLEYESPHTIDRREMAVSVNMAAAQPIKVDKTAEVLDKLAEFCAPNGRKLSPTSFINYAQCPLKFYYHSVARLDPGEEITEEIDAPTFGTILHKAMELLYRPITGIQDPSPQIEQVKDGPEVVSAVDMAIREEYFKGEDVPVSDYAGNLLLARDIVTRYINRCILPYDARQRGFTVYELEKRVGVEFVLDRNAGPRRSVFFGGFSDRVDMLADGTLRIIDYKTGAMNLEFKGIPALFSQSPADQNSAALQTFLYSMMFNRLTGKDVQPALYYVRFMNAQDYSPLLVDKAAGVPVLSYLRYKDEFERLLTDKLSELFHSATPFMQCTDPKPCQWCDFNVICKR